MIRILWIIFLFSYYSFAQTVQYSWPYYENNIWPVQEINSNVGDYRRINRFHLGIDVQEKFNTRVFPITTAQLVFDPIFDSEDNEYTIILQHGTYDPNSQSFTPIPDSYSVYTHLRNPNPNLAADFVVFTSTYLSEGDDLFENHLHFNYVTDLNSTTDLNDDAVSNPFNLNWSDFSGSDNTPPIIHNLYMEVTDATVQVLNYPDDYTPRFYENDPPQNNFYRISYGNPLPYGEPKVLISAIGSNCEIKFVVQATDDWEPTGTNLTPHAISAYLDHNSETNEDQPYFYVEFDEIQAGRPNAEIVYYTIPPLQTVFGTEQQYYRFYAHPTNTMVLPRQTVNNPINIATGPNNEEGLHRIEIILLSESVYPFFTSEGVTAYFYFYLLKNNEGYIDLAQSSP